MCEARTCGPYRDIHARPDGRGRELRRHQALHVDGVHEETDQPRQALETYPADEDLPAGGVGLRGENGACQRAHDEERVDGEDPRGHGVGNVQALEAEKHAVLQNGYGEGDGAVYPETDAECFGEPGACFAVAVEICAVED